MSSFVSGIRERAHMSPCDRIGTHRWYQSLQVESVFVLYLWKFAVTGGTVSVCTSESFQHEQVAPVVGGNRRNCTRVTFLDMKSSVPAVCL